MRKITTIVVHCTATPEGRHHTVADVRAWHQAKGWADIGYHYLVQLDGTVEKGRDDEHAGAHVQGHNSNSIGVVYVGGIDAVHFKAKDTRTAAQKAALIALLKKLKEIYPTATILGHRDFPGVAKACPSFDARNEYRSLRP